MNSNSILAGEIVILLFSVIVHEVMHGLVALKFGDHTAKNAGRLTLNPLPHIDPIGTILIPLTLWFTHSPILFGWAKPVPVNPFNFNNLRKGELMVSAAGILSNLGLAIITALIYRVSIIFVDLSILQPFVLYSVYINLFLAVFNSLPIPPLDGSKIISSYLPYKYLRSFGQLDKYGLIVLILLLFLPFGGISLINFISAFLVSLTGLLLGF